MDPLESNAAVLTVRDFGIEHSGWDFFHHLFARIREAESEIGAMRSQMLRLLPQVRLISWMLSKVYFGERSTPNRRLKVF